MGIRINKVLGYGFKHCKFDKDPRFNEWVFNDQDIWNEDKRTEFIYFLKEKQSKFLKEKQSKLSSDDFFDIAWDLAWLEKKECFADGDTLERLLLYDFIKYNYYDMEKENPIGPIIFTMPNYKSWNRYDDIIDYIECGIDNRGAVDSVKFYLDDAGQSTGIYPHTSFVNRNTGKRVKFTPSDRRILTGILLELKKANNPHLIHKNSPKEKSEFEKAGVENLIQWQRWVVPEVPSLIVNFCEFMDIFKNPLTVYRLRPMIYTFWC